MFQRDGSERKPVCDVKLDVESPRWEGQKVYICDVKIQADRQPASKRFYTQEFGMSL